LNGWQPAVAPLEATPMYDRPRERDIYMRGLRQGFIAGLYGTLALTALGVVIYAIVSAA
jgi:hypothetical protein